MNEEKPTKKQMMKKLCAFTIDTYTKRMFVRGMRDGLPIGLGYLAVSFALGIAARRAGLGVLAAAVSPSRTFRDLRENRYTQSSRRGAKPHKTSVSAQTVWFVR